MHFAMYLIGVMGCLSLETLKLQMPKIMDDLKSHDDDDEEDENINHHFKIYFPALPQPLRTDIHHKGSMSQSLRLRCACLQPPAPNAQPPPPVNPPPPAPQWNAQPPTTSSTQWNAQPPPPPAPQWNTKLPLPSAPTISTSMGLGTPIIENQNKPGNRRSAYLYAEYTRQTSQKEDRMKRLTLHLTNILITSISVILLYHFI